MAKSKMIYDKKDKRMETMSQMRREGEIGKKMSVKNHMMTDGPMPSKYGAEHAKCEMRCK